MYGGCFSLLSKTLYTAGTPRALSNARGFTALESASRFAQIQKLYSDQLREWYWQRNMGTKYQTWSPPGVLFCGMKKDHFDIGSSNMPTWENWWFHDLDKPLIIVVGSGIWALDLAHKNAEYNVLYVDSDDKNVFNTMLRAMDVYQINVDEMEPFFNFRVVFGNYRLLPQILPRYNDMFKPVRLHLHFPPKQKTIAREAQFRGMTVKAPSFEVQGLPPSLHKQLTEMMAARGTIHVASDNLDHAQTVASQMIELKHVFDPICPFPFFQEGLPPNYGKLAGAAADKPIFYQEWRKSDRKQPNALFKGRVLTT
eukprot:GEMP01056639.1.p1 GENE.GEMP01056639.1~~GEMP01056639.1.p1  ORF type:complete len:311 (+),score=63.41 GEMP01056639.1:184-1116(+)